MTVVAMIAVAVIAFAAGVAFGVYAAAKAIASGKVENVKVIA